MRPAVADDGAVGPGCTTENEVATAVSGNVRSTAKELLRTHTIVTNCPQLAMGVGSFSTRARSDWPPQAIVVRQQILEDRQDGRADVGLFAYWNCDRWSRYCGRLQPTKRGATMRRRKRASCSEGCDVEERLWYEFLTTGMREQEVIFTY